MAACPLPFAALNSKMPSGTPSRAPTSAGSACAAASPPLTCCGVAPSARASADERRASSTVAQAVNTALSTASETSATVRTSSICSSRLITGSLSPPPLWKRWPARVWKASTATSPVTVTAMLAAPSAARRGRRATSRSPSSSGTGSRLESLISVARRRGRRAPSASALTVLVRAARRAGTSVAARATASATPITSPAFGRVSDGAPGVPTRPAPGLVISGAASHPASSPAAAAASATSRFSARSTAATTLGVLPTALSSPTRRVCSAIRPPASTATLATASTPVSQAPTARTACWSCTSRPAAA